MNRASSGISENQVIRSAGDAFDGVGRMGIASNKFRRGERGQVASRRKADDGGAILLTLTG